MDKTDNSYSYMTMIDMLFGKSKLNEVSNKFGIKATTRGFNIGEPAN